MGELVALNLDSLEIKYLCNKDKRLAKVISMVGPIEYLNREGENGYAFLVHEIVEQMLSIKAGRKIYERLESLCDGNITPESIAALSVEEIRSTGTSLAKAECINIVTDEIVSGRLVLDDLKELSDEDAIRKLTSIRGIGNWTAKMYLLFVLGRQDILPYEDGAFLQSYRWMYKTTDIAPASIKKRCAKWKPYSSIAARYLYRALDNGFTKEKFHLYK